MKILWIGPFFSDEALFKKKAANQAAAKWSRGLLKGLKHAGCENIEEFYRTRHLGEYKKSRVSKLIANNIAYKTDITEEIKEIITFISKL